MTRGEGRVGHDGDNRVARQESLRDREAVSTCAVRVVGWACALLSGRFTLWQLTTTLDIIVYLRYHYLTVVLILPSVKDPFRI